MSSSSQPIAATMSSPLSAGNSHVLPAFTGNDSPQPSTELGPTASGDGEALPQSEQVISADDPATPEKPQLQDWEVLTGSEEKTKMQVKDIPSQVKEQLVKLQPTFRKASTPILEKFEQIRKSAAAAQIDFVDKYPTDEVLKAGLAIALLFAGGRFPLTVACAQSFHMSCYQRAKISCQDVQDSYISVSGQRSLQDASLLADIKRIIKGLVLAKSASDREEAMTRALNLVKCIDPYKTKHFLNSLWPGIIAVTATLRSRLAFAACLGANIGQIVFEAMQKGSWLERRLKQTSAEGATKVGLHQVCIVASCGLSFFITRVMAALNSALQGSTALTKILFQYILCQKILPEKDRSTIGKCVLPLMGSQPEMGKEEEIVKWSVAMIGFYVQVRRQQQYPLPIRVPLAPLYLVEYCLARLASARSF